jgi:hypothetical protein
MPIRTSLGAMGAALLLAACGGMITGPTATRENLLTASATVESVDASTRDVALRDNVTGETFSVRAGPEVRNFGQLAPGDVVEVDYYEAVTLSMAGPGTPSDPETAVVAGRAPAGEAPGGVAVVSTTMVVTMSNYDEDSGIATFLLPDGTLTRTRVAPEMRGFAETTSPGDRVEVTLTEAIAVGIVEPGA